MKLIAENTYENHLLYGLSKLLEDLGIENTAHLREDSIALTSLSVSDLSLFNSPLAAASDKDKAAFLLSIEEKIEAAMILAGYEIIYKELEHIFCSQREHTLKGE